jgi:hypothetical protein
VLAEHADRFVTGVTLRNPAEVEPHARRHQLNRSVPRVQLHAPPPDALARFV